MVSVLKIAAFTAATLAVIASGCGAAGNPNVLWQAGTAGKDGWRNASDGQCGSPAVEGDRFTFALVKNGTNCLRNQAQPTDSTGGDFRLTDGQQYTWTFHYSDGAGGTPGGMSYDRDARSSIFQIHPYHGGDPCVGLGFYNGGVVGAPQQWLFTNCSGNVWNGPYTAGEEDDWKIVVLVSQGKSGHVTLYRNGAQVADAGGPTYKNTGMATGGPWWNFGPYKWRWKLPNGGGSTTNQMNAMIAGMTLTTP